MISRLTAGFTSRLPSSFSFAFFSSMASSSNPSPAQLQRNEIEELVEKTIADHQVVIFSKSWCGYCRKVKKLFHDNFEGVVTAKVVELDEHKDGNAIQNYLFKKTEQSTVPNVFVNQTHIGGADKTQAALDNNTLAQILKLSESEPTRQA